MENVNDLVEKLVDDLDEIPADAKVAYEVWAIGYDEEDHVAGAEMFITSFDDPDMAVAYAKELALADVINMAADDECDVTTEVYSIHIEVETVVPDGDNGTMNIGTIYKKTLEIFEELPEYVTLSSGEGDYVIMDNGDIKVPCSILNDYNINDYFTAVFTDNGRSQPMIYQIKAIIGNDYVCEFV